MNKNQYLKRIHYLNEINVDDETLMQLHEHHVLHVPTRDFWIINRVGAHQTFKIRRTKTETFE
jgi:hypothetical protein